MVIQDRNLDLRVATSPALKQSRSDKPRLIQLDVLRGIAILLVLGSHMPIPATEAGRFSLIATLWARFGWTGVDLFFVLSGFLIGGLLFNELRTQPRLNVRRFLIRRCFKIWPSYYLCVLLALLLVVVREHGRLGAALGIVYPNFIHIQNYVWGDRPIRHTWSLAVEEHFYLALPLFLWIVTRKREDHRHAIPAVPVMAGAVMIFCLAFRFLINLHRPFSPYSHVFYTHVRMDSLMFGVLLAYLYHFHAEMLRHVMRYRILLTAAAIAMLCPMFFLDRETHSFVWTVGYSLLYIGYGILLLLVMHLPPRPRFLSNSPGTRLARGLAAVGVSSYTIYLWHDMFAARPIGWLFRSHLLHNPTGRWCLATSLYVVLAIVFGDVMGRIVDKPALRLRERLFPSKISAIAHE